MQLIRWVETMKCIFEMLKVMKTEFRTIKDDNEVS